MSYVPNLPFGKKIKGADDFALAHCRSDDGFDFQPLIDIIERATYIPANPPSVKYPGEEQKRKIAKWLEEAEQVQELQEVLRKSQQSWCEPALRKLFILQAPHILQISNERAAGDLFDSQSEGGKLLLMGLAMKDNPALTRLHEACAWNTRFRPRHDIKGEGEFYRKGALTGSFLGIISGYLIV